MVGGRVALELKHDEFGDCNVAVTRVAASFISVA